MTSNIQRVRNLERLLFGVSVLAAIALTSNVSATVRYVDLNSGSPTPPFTNWTAAATNIQDAIDAADAGDEIVVTNGVYQTGGRAVYGAMTNRVAVTKPVTVRSVNGPQLTVITGSGTMRCVYLTNGASLSGFTLANGAGGGVASEAAGALVSNCAITGNSGGGASGVTLNNCTLTSNAGGGAVNCTLNNCILTGNSASQGGGAKNSILNNCTLTGNSASKAGGGAYSGTLNNCALIGNTCTSSGGTTGDGGGGAYSATLNNCTLSGNSVAIYSEGGGAYFGALNNCTLTGNTASFGTGGASHANLNNCIVFFNNDNNGNGNANTVGCNMNYCCTTPLAESGTGNFTNAPLFANFSRGDLRLSGDSPCINSGNNACTVGTTDVAGQPRIVVGTVDVGAHEYQGPYTLSGSTDGGGSVIIGPPMGNDFSNLLSVVTATPAPGWTLLQWLGDAAGTNPVLNINMTRNKAVRAVFGTTLNTTVVGDGSIVGSPVSPWHPYGNRVRLTAVPTTGNHLDYWTDSASGMMDNPMTFTVTNASPTVTAVFANIGSTQTNALTVIPDGRGQVGLTPPGNLYPLNTNVVLQATPDAGQEFFGWSGDASSTANPLVVTMTSNMVITARFTKRPWLHGEGNPDLLSQAGFGLTLTGEFGAAYEFFGSTDLVGWASLGTVANTWGTVQFTDAEAATNAHRVYRALQLP